MKEITEKLSLLKNDISKQDLNHWKIIDSICYYINDIIDNENKILILINFLNKLSCATENDGKSLFFKNEFISLYIKLIEKYKNNYELFSNIVDYITQIIINSIINQNNIINNDKYWNLFKEIYNNDKICNSNSYFKFLSSFNKILYSEETKLFQKLLFQKVKEELVKIYYNKEKEDLDKNIILNIYIIYRRLAMSSSNEIIELFFDKDDENTYILDLLIKFSHFFDELINQTLYIIGDIASSEDDIINLKLLETNCFNFLKETILNKKTSNLNKKFILFALSNLCNEKLFHEELNSKNLFEDIISIIENVYSIDVVKEGLFCLGNAIYIGNEILIIKLIECGLFECIFKIMDEYNDKNVLKSCFDLILIIIEKGNYYLYKDDNEDDNNLFLEKFNKLGGEEKVQKLYTKAKTKDLIQAIDKFFKKYYCKK